MFKIRYCKTDIIHVAVCVCVPLVLRTIENLILQNEVTAHSESVCYVNNEPYIVECNISINLV